LNSPLRTRSIGLIKASAGLAAVFLMWLLGLMRLLDRLMGAPRDSPSSDFGTLLTVAMCAPVVLFFVGLWELATGRPFRLLESAWGRLKEWQQGLLSFLLIMLALGILLLAIHWITGVEFF